MIRWERGRCKSTSLARRCTIPERISSPPTCTSPKTEYVRLLSYPHIPSSPLAQILCWELVSKRGGQWILHYVKSAYAETDVPDQVPELISQRRRWINGSFFAAVHSIVKFNYIYRSSHTTTRKFWLHVQLVYQVYTLIFGWFSLANYYISFVRHFRNVGVD
jgi:hypothetical protein